VTKQQIKEKITKKIGDTCRKLINVDQWYNYFIAPTNILHFCDFSPISRPEHAESTRKLHHVERSDFHCVTTAKLSYICLLQAYSEIRHYA